MKGIRNLLKRAGCFALVLAMSIGIQNTLTAEAAAKLTSDDFGSSSTPCTAMLHFHDKEISVIGGQFARIMPAGATEDVHVAYDANKTTCKYYIKDGATYMGSSMNLIVTTEVTSAGEMGRQSGLSYRGALTGTGNASIKVTIQIAKNKTKVDFVFYILFFVC